MILFQNLIDIETFYYRKIQQLGLCLSFAIIFAETGLIVASFLMPFAYGDALIFQSDFYLRRTLNIWIVIPLLMFAAVLGDNVNYYVGKRFGDYIMNSEKDRFIKKKSSKKRFFDKMVKFYHYCSFCTCCRTIVPFSLCGSTKLKYSTFLTFSIIELFFGLV